ncbi:MAG: lysophospholipid acyltransferase family protein [Candidatus Eisenbacteria bacterium]|nr:lysophospholipid acyltransferase family protein [Candidatus Eisenbacteria bacterium]
MKKNRFLKRIRNYLLYWFVLLVTMAARVLPRRLMLSIMGLLGTGAYYLLSKPRKKTIENLEIAFPELRHEERRAIAKGVFRDIGRNLVDILRLPFMSASELDKIVRVRGKEVLDDVLSRRKGVVVVTGHIGSWELLASYFSRKGYRVNALMRTLYDPRLDSLLARIRESAGIVQIPRDGALGKIFRALKRGEIVGFLLDQDTKVEGTFVEFMGKEAYTPVGAVRVAMRSGAPIIPAAIRLDADGKHVIEIGRELDLTFSGDYAEDIKMNTQKCTSSLEAFIRATPTQWVWMHERWKTRPA